MVLRWSSDRPPIVLRDDPTSRPPDETSPLLSLSIGSQWLARANAPVARAETLRGGRVTSRDL